MNSYKPLKTETQLFCSQRCFCFSTSVITRCDCGAHVELVFASSWEILSMQIM